MNKRIIKTKSQSLVPNLCSLVPGPWSVRVTHLIDPRIRSLDVLCHILRTIFHLHKYCFNRGVCVCVRARARAFVLVRVCVGYSRLDGNKRELGLTFNKPHCRQLHMRVRRVREED